MESIPMQVLGTSKESSESEEEEDAHGEEVDRLNEVRLTDNIPELKVEPRKSVCRELFLSSKLNLLLVFIPVVMVGILLQWSSSALFLTAMLAMIPLAERLGFVTEELAKHTNSTIGGLINATMGNVTEVIIAIVALKNGLLRVVQVSLIGSILSNLLLVLGTACFVGGLKHPLQTFNKTAISTNSGILLLAVMTMLFPAVLDATHDADYGNSDQEAILLLSRLSSGAGLVVYAMLIIYQLKTHSHLFEEAEESDDEPPLMSMRAAFILMAVITAIIAVLSEAIVACIEDAAAEMGLPILFIGTILLPIVGNAAEHASAVMFAYKNQMDIAIGISVGSASQISLFVIPLCVLIAIPLNQPLSLDFHIFETTCIFITVLVVCFVTANGETDWLKGAMLVVAYFLIACGFWIHR